MVKSEWISFSPKTAPASAFLQSSSTLTASSATRNCWLASDAKGSITSVDIMDDYIQHLLSYVDIPSLKPLKIVVNAGNGGAGPIVDLLEKHLPFEFIKVFHEPNGDFPNGVPNPLLHENRAVTHDAVLEHKADLGVAWDGDFDRCFLWDETGEFIEGYYIVGLLAKAMLAKEPGAKIVHDPRLTWASIEMIEQLGGVAVQSKSGHAFMKEKMRTTGALLGGEFSGHIFFGERWFGFDDGMYAAGRLAEIMSTQGDSLDDIIDTFPATVNTPEILIPVTEQNKQPLMDRIIRNTDFSSGKVNTMDGIRVDFSEGWGLVRASNTSSALTARFEATSAEALEMIMSEFREQIALVDSSLELTF